MGGEFIRVRARAIWVRARARAIRVRVIALEVRGKEDEWEVIILG
jgi:hypothetical protein